MYVSCFICMQSRRRNHGICACVRVLGGWILHTCVQLSQEGLIALIVTKVGFATKVCYVWRFD